MWFVESGSLVDRVDTTLTARAQVYRGALGSLVSVERSSLRPRAFVCSSTERYCGRLSCRRLLVCSSAAEALGALQCQRAVQFALDTLARDLHPVASIAARFVTVGATAPATCRSLSSNSVVADPDALTHGGITNSTHPSNG